MTRPAQQLSVRLTRLSLGTAAIALLLVGLVLDAAMHLMQRSALSQDVTAQARVVAENLAAAVMFGDAEAAHQVLASLERTPRVASADVFDLERKPIARHRRIAADAPMPPPAGWSAGLTEDQGSFIALEPVTNTQGRQVGWLRLQVPLAPLWRMTLSFAGVTVVAAAVAMALAWALGAGMRRDVARVERRLDHLAFHDPVTGLFNRHASADHLVHGGPASAWQQGFAVASFDLDNFKTINDTLGHPIGDQVLRRVADRLLHHMPPRSQAYRFGGDEFVVVSPCTGDEADAMKLGHQIRQALGEPLRLSGYEVPLSGSIGVARWPLDSDSPEEVLLAADIAMYRAKQRGKNGIVVFTPDMRADSQDRLRLESDLRAAIRGHELRLHYQPIVCCHSGRWLGAEALVRWQHPERGLIGPADFIEAAEGNGLTVPLGGWVLAEAARQLAAWRSQGMPAVRVAVNVSARQLRRGLLLSQVSEAAQGAGLALDELGLEIELTEHTLVEDVHENLVVLGELRQAGVRIAIDDFGTGLSSLAYLKRLPIHKLKIDRSFVKGLPDDAGDRAIVGAALSMAHALGLEVVAEGVETADQRAALQVMGCEYAQGWLFGKPMPPDVFAKALCQQAVTLA